MRDDAMNGVRIAFIGLGEAGAAVAGGLDRTGVAALAAFDVKFDDPQTSAAMAARCSSLGLAAATDHRAAVHGAGIVLSLVTADRALEAAQACAPHLAAGALYVDGNSCAPQTKRAAAAAVEASGASYTDLAIMAPIHPRGPRTPMLAAGPAVDRAVALLEALGMVPRAAGTVVGQASAVKMCRSVMIKGMEALVAECLLAARAAGVEAAVLASLEASDPDIHWRERAAYALERVAVHGTRRAAEMHEVAATVAALGLPSAMSAATAEWQARIGALGLPADRDGLEPQADRILAALGLAPR
jgi:3-hydroxyisobutyrate dehydrogenase-like beta-hydroxyacid dehydrogenase